MVENPILLHPDYNSSVRHIEQAIFANAHLPVDQQDSVIVVLVLNQLVFHLLVLMIWGFVLFF